MRFLQGFGNHHKTTAKAAANNPNTTPRTIPAISTGVIVRPVGSGAVGDAVGEVALVLSVSALPVVLPVPGLEVLEEEEEEVMLREVVVVKPGLASPDCTARAPSGSPFVHVKKALVTVGATTTIGTHEEEGPEVGPLLCTASTQSTNSAIIIRKVDTRGI